MPESTVEQQDKTRAGQRRINIMWEATQGIIAVGITGAQIYCSIHKVDSREITYAFFLIVSMYFVRTNHQRSGGVGTKPEEHR